jgi:hypothetical protein
MTQKQSDYSIVREARKAEQKKPADKQPQPKK